MGKLPVLERTYRGWRHLAISRQSAINALTGYHCCSDQTPKHTPTINHTHFKHTHFKHSELTVLFSHSDHPRLAKAKRDRKYTNVPLSDELARAGGVGSLLLLAALTLPPLSLVKAPGTSSMPPHRPVPDMVTRGRTIRRKSLNEFQCT